MNNKEKKNNEFEGERVKPVEKPKDGGKHRIAQKLDTAGWGLFFLWVGIAFLADVGEGVGLLGVAIITLAGQAARIYFKLKPEGFWVVVGVLFALGGFWELFQVKVDLLPVLLAAAGIALIISIFRGKRPSQFCQNVKCC